MLHTHRFALDAKQPVSAEAYHYRSGTILAEHCHDAGQLVHAIAGTMRVSTGEALWIVPPQRAVWIPSGVLHSIAMLSDVSMRTVYVTSARTAHLPDHCCVISVSGLLREVIVSLSGLPPHYRLSGRSKSLIDLFLDDIHVVGQEPLYLREPKDRRVRVITEALHQCPADDRTLADWAHHAHASERTIARLFIRETGLAYAQWRQQLRLILAIELLAQRVPVTEVAMELGYSTPSAFSYMFRRALGVAPRDFFAAQ